MTTLIAAENSIGIFAILCAIVALAIWLEQRYVWASKVTGCILVLLTTLALANLRIIPESAPAYDFVGAYMVPMALPLLLFRANIKTIVKDSGRLIILFLIGALGTIVGAIISWPVAAKNLAEGGKFLAMITGSYIGGGVNFVAMAENYGASGTTVATANVADALTMMFFFFALMVIPSLKFFRKHWKHPLEDKIEAAKAAGEESKDLTNAAAYWARKEVSLKDMAFSLGISAVIVGVSAPLASFLGSVIPTGNFVFNFLNGLFGSQYFIITVVTVILATAFSKQFADIRGAQELGTWFIYMFFATMSAPVSIRLLVNDAPIFFVICIIVVAFNIIFCLLGAKFLRFNIEDAMVCSNANIGGGATAAALAVAKGWESLIIPGILVGTLGNVIGNIAGILIGTMFGA